jgi:hypothetical protein
MTDVLNFKFIPDHLRTRARLVAFVVSGSKDRPSFWRTGIPEFLKKKRWLNNKFFMEVIEKVGDSGVKAIKSIYSELDGEELDMTSLVKLYPGAIKCVSKTEQNKAMANAVLASGRANELKNYLSLKFITKSTSPLFLSSEDKGIKDKVERVLTGQPKAPPPYIIFPGNEIELELTDDEIGNLSRSGIPFVI